MSKNIKKLIRKYLWVIFVLLGGAIGGYMLFFTPHTREVVSLSIFLPKVLALILACFAVALFPRSPKHGWFFLFLLMALFLIPFENSISFAWVSFNPDPVLQEAGIERGWLLKEYWTAMYVLLLPTAIFSLSLAYRIGGASSEKTFKLSLAGLCIYFSCLNILIFQNIWHFRYNEPYSTVCSWVYHVSYFIGRDPYLYELIYWCIGFMILAALIYIAPLGKWGRRIEEKLFKEE